MSYFEDTREVDTYQKNREDGFRNEAIARRDDQLKRLTAMRQAELTRTHMGQGDAEANPSVQAIPFANGQAQGSTGDTPNLPLIRTKPAIAPDQTDAETLRLTRGKAAPNPDEAGLAALSRMRRAQLTGSKVDPMDERTYGEYVARQRRGGWPGAQGTEQQPSDMKAFQDLKGRNDTRTEANPTPAPAEDARFARPPVGTPSGGYAGDFVSRIRQAESSGNMNAIGPSVLGQGTAKSDMQVMDRTNGNPGFGARPAQSNSLEERSRVGREYAAAMFARYGNEQEAAAAYNWGPGNYDRWKASGANPAAMPAETRNYVAKVTGGQPATQTAQTPARGGMISNANAATPDQFTPEQFFSAAPQVDQQTSMAKLRLQQLREMAAVTRDPAALQKMQEQAIGLQAGIREAQVYQLAAQASSGNEGALSQLVQMMGNVGVTRTAQGYVMVDPASGRAMSPPMTAGELAKGIYGNISAQARAQAAESAKKRDEIAMDTQRQVAVEGVKNQGAQVLKGMEGDIAREKAFLDNTFKGQDYKVTPGRDGGPTIVTTRSGVFEVRNAPANKFGSGGPTLVDITPTR